MSAKRINAKTQRPRRVAKPRKPKRCQWVAGVMSKNFSGWITCGLEPMFEVHQDGVCLGHVCGQHQQDATDHGWQIR
jgi:hypothetical protein